MRIAMFMPGLNTQVWATDICYIPMAHGFMYLVAIMDWYSRRVLAWRVSNTFDSDFCVEALEDALTRYGPPEIFNTDQGAQFTSTAFTTVLKTHAVAISMDGKGRWVDNVFVERLWRSVKYEDVYLHAYDTPAALRAGLTGYFQFYNGRRRHSSLGRRTPDVVYFGTTGRGGPCRSRIRHQAAAGSWTMPRQWEIQRTWLHSAWAAVRSPAKPNGV